MPFEKFDKRLNVMLKYLTPMDVLKQLSIMNRPASTIEFRFGKAKEANVPLIPYLLHRSKKDFNE